MTAAAVHAVVYARDLAPVALFYERVLDLERLEETPGFVLLSGNHYELSIVAIPDDLAAGIVISRPAAPREDTPIKLSFLVRELNACLVAVVREGGSVQNADAAWCWRGQVHLDVLDPEGNVFQLRQVQA